MKRITSLLRDEEGAALVEYAFLVAFIALVALVGSGLGDTMSNFFHVLGVRLNQQL